MYSKEHVVPQCSIVRDLCLCPLLFAGCWPGLCASSVLAAPIWELQVESRGEGGYKVYVPPHFVWVNVCKPNLGAYVAAAAILVITQAYTFILLYFFPSGYISMKSGVADITIFIFYKYLGDFYGSQKAIWEIKTMLQSGILLCSRAAYLIISMNLVCVRVVRWEAWQYSGLYVCVCVCVLLHLHSDDIAELCHREYCIEKRDMFKPTLMLKVMFMNFSTYCL